MSYNVVAEMAEDLYLGRRLTAAAATELGLELDPVAWVAAQQWRLASSPGWDAAWASAVAGGVPLPGQDDAVITDGMILSAVQTLIGAPS